MTQGCFPSIALYGRDDGSSFKVALLSGPPGIGKTTAATLACKVSSDMMGGFSTQHINECQPLILWNYNEILILDTQCSTLLTTGVWLYICRAERQLNKE